MVENKKITKQSVESKINMKTGEILEVVNKQEFVVKREPDYIKLYLEDIAQLNGLPNSDVLFLLARKMNYDGEVVLVASIVTVICDSVGIGKNHFYKILKGYCDKEILFKTERSVYVFNPYIFARGSWDDIKNIRMTIDYTRKGRTIKTDINIPEDVEEIKKEFIKDMLSPTV